MKIAISTDEHTPLIDVLIAEVEARGHTVTYFGPRRGDKPFDWPEVTLEAVQEMRRGEADEGIVLCWTGTGCALMANKVPGVRAALCVDAETAKGARVWNHANVLALSLRLTTEATLREIVKAWFETPFSTDAWNLEQIRRVHAQEIGQHSS